MAKPLSQAKAKLMVKDYLRETGRKGVTNLMQDMRRIVGHEIFGQRTFEYWLKERKRMLEEPNWVILQKFLESEKFKSYVPYANEGAADKRLKQVAAGYLALYTATNTQGIAVMPALLEKQCEQAMPFLDSNWENNPNPNEQDIPRVICKIEPIIGERYAKFAYMALFRSKQISATGIVIYLGQDEREDADYCHNFILQLWRRRDPESDSKLPSGLIHFTAGRNQPEFAISNIINQYFYKEQAPLGADGDFLFALEPDMESARYKKSGSQAKVNRFNWAAEAGHSNSVMLKRVKYPIPEEEEIVDQLLEDVLPHGFTAT